MVTLYGMSNKYDMMALETMNNIYLSKDTSLTCSPTVAADIDHEVQEIIYNAHEKAKKIISDNLNAMHKAAEYLIEKETITGEEFMKILQEK